MITKYRAILRMKYVEMFAYQLSTMVWMFGTMVQPLITMMLWMNIYPDQGDTFVLYFVALIMVERLISAWDVWEMDRQIREARANQFCTAPEYAETSFAYPDGDVGLCADKASR